MAAVDYRWQGAEAKVGVGKFCGRDAIYKERVKKAYRHPQLDQRLTSRRVLQEVRCMVKARRNGVRAPVIYSVDLQNGQFIMEHIRGVTLKQTIMNLPIESSTDLSSLGEAVGRMVAGLHNVDTIHGDLTTSNILVEQSTGQLVLIDFGLSYGSNLIEDKAVDLYVLERALTSTHPETADHIFQAVLKAYGVTAKNQKNILNKLADVQLRGRKRDMIG